MQNRSLVSVVGARPQFIKLAPICRAMSSGATEYRHYILHTGQHYDYEMSDIFFRDLGIPLPDVNLDIRSARHGAQTAAMLQAIEKELEDQMPDGVIVYGDTNSTLAATLAASKLHIPLFHVESGLRSLDRRMPEEINRVVADHCSDLLFAPTLEAMHNLEREGLRDRAVQVGDVMYDAVLYNVEVAARTSRAVDTLGMAGKDFAIATAHRASTTKPEVLRDLVTTLLEVAEDQIPILFPIHPRTKSLLDLSQVGGSSRLVIIEPQSYPDMLALVQRARLVLTDSGGLQKEAAILGTPCITLRETTEWVETLEIGANTLAGLSRPMIRSAITRILTTPKADWTTEIRKHYGDGNAGGKIVTAIQEWIDSQDTPERDR